MTNCPGDQVAVEPDAVSKNRGVTLRQNDKFWGRKKLALTPELRRQLPLGSMNKQWYYRSFSANGFGYLRSTLEENMELISKNILAERKRYQYAVDNLQSQVVQLEEKNHQKSVKIETLQLYNSEKLKIIDSLAEGLNETKWKREAMWQICNENLRNRPFEESVLMVSGTMDKMSVFRSHRDSLQSCLADLESKSPLAPLVETVQQLKSGLDKCIGIIEKAAGRELSDDRDTVTAEPLQDLQFDFGSVVETIDGLKAARNVECDADGAVELWDIVKDLFWKNQRLANRVTSLNMHKVGLQMQLKDMENSTRKLEIKTATETEEVEMKQEILNQNESLIQQHWDEMDTSREIVVQTQRAQDIDQELEDLQIEYHNYDKENKQQKTNLSHLKNELTEYQLKCEQLERENKRLENEKKNLLEAYVKSWGHHNEKQKIKYTGKLVKSIHNITQEIKSYEIELEKHELNNVNSPARTPVFSKTQPKSEKSQRKLAIIDTTKNQKVDVFGDSTVRNFWYQ